MSLSDWKQQLRRWWWAILLAVAAVVGLGKMPPISWCKRTRAVRLPRRDAATATASHFTPPRPKFTCTRASLPCSTFPLIIKLPVNPQTNHT